MKTFYGGIFICKEKLKKEGINYPIKLEYYKTINEDEIIDKSKQKYGIQIIKTEYKKEEVKVEREDIDSITNDEKEAYGILKMFKENEVTPVGAKDVMRDIYPQKV